MGRTCSNQHWVGRHRARGSLQTYASPTCQRPKGTCPSCALTPTWLGADTCRARDSCAPSYVVACGWGLPVTAIPFKDGIAGEKLGRVRTFPDNWSFQTGRRQHGGAQRQEDTAPRLSRLQPAVVPQDHTIQRLRQMRQRTLGAHYVAVSDAHGLCACLANCCICLVRLHAPCSTDLHSSWMHHQRAPIRQCGHRDVITALRPPAPSSGHPCNDLAPGHGLRLLLRLQTTPS